MASDINHTVAGRVDLLPPGRCAWFAVVMSPGARTDVESAAVVSAFLDALARKDVAAGMLLVDDDIVYRNVSLPPIRGAAAVGRLFERWAALRATGFEVVVHRIAVDGQIVLTERTDVLRFGSVRQQFWVCGTFEVVDGRITLWRDYFDYGNFLAALCRGIAGAAVPSLRARLPHSAPR